jgi:hypothetical protein
MTYISTNHITPSLILLGILVSYLSQHYRIIARRSSEGISPYFVLLGTTGGTCALSNILVLPASRADIACCKEISEFDCFAGLLGILQVALQWSCFAIMYVSMTRTAWIDSLTHTGSDYSSFYFSFPMRPPSLQRRPRLVPPPSVLPS